MKDLRSPLWLRCVNNKLAKIASGSQSFLQCIHLAFIFDQEYHLAKKAVRSTSRPFYILGYYEVNDRRLRYASANSQRTFLRQPTTSVSHITAERTASDTQNAPHVPLSTPLPSPSIVVLGTTFLIPLTSAFGSDSGFDSATRSSVL